MQVSVLQEALINALTRLAAVIDPCPYLPVLGNVLLQTVDTRLALTATNLETTLTIRVGAKVDHPGATTLPAKQFREYVHDLSPARVDLKLDSVSETTRIICRADVSNLKGIVATEFPPIPAAADSVLLSMPAEALKMRLIEAQTSIANEDNRPILTGLLFRCDGEHLDIVGTDGFQLAVTRYVCGSACPPFEFVLPGTAVRVLINLIGAGDREIAIEQREGLVFFEMGDWTLASQILEGRYPDYEAVRPKSAATSASLYVNDLYMACRRARTFCRDNDYALDLDFRPATSSGEPGTLRVFGRSAERGDAETQVDARIDGAPLFARVNVVRLMNMLDVLMREKVESVQIESEGNLRAITIQPVRAENAWFGMIMVMSHDRQPTPPDAVREAEVA